MPILRRHRLHPGLHLLRVSLVVLHAGHVDAGDSAGDTQTVDRALAEGRRLERADWPPRLRLRFCEFATTTCTLSGDTAGWANGVRQLLALAEQGGFENYAALMQVELADLALMEGDAPRAVEAGKKALERLHRLGITTGGWGYAATCLCSAQVMAGELSDALDTARAAVRLLRAVDLIGILYFPLTLWCSRAGRPAEAARLIGCCDAWYAAQRSRPEGAAVRLHGVVTVELEAALGSAEVERLRAEGAALTAEEAAALQRALIGANGQPE
jgi:hypothetical protein